MDAMPIYVYETSDLAKPVRRFELRQSFHDEPLRVDPKTGEAVHRTPVVAHLLQLSLHIRDHLIRRLSTVTHIDRAIVDIILGRRTVTPGRIPVAAVPVIVTATDQLHPGVVRPIPTLVMPFRVIGAEYFILRTPPALTSLN